MLNPFLLFEFNLHTHIDDLFSIGYEYKYCASVALSKMTLFVGYSNMSTSAQHAVLVQITLMKRKSICLYMNDQYNLFVVN